MKKLIKPDMVDEENPEWSEEDFRRAGSANEVLPAELMAILPKRKPGQRGVQKKPKKEAVTMRYSQEVLDYFRESGPGWQSRMNEALKEWVHKHGA